MLIVLALLLVLTTPARAFDGEHEGLMLGGGLGAAMSVISQDIQGASFDTFTRFGPAFDLRAGWGASEAILIFASVRGSWIRYDTAATDGSDVVHGTIGLGMVQYFDRGRSNWYSTGQLGFAVFDLVDEDTDALTGFGFGAGVGRMLREHLATELVVGWEATSLDTSAGEFGNSVITVRLQVVGMAY